MSKPLIRGCFVALLMSGAVVMSGCATTSAETEGVASEDVRQAQTTANAADRKATQALQTARQAEQKADRALQRTEELEQKLDRMFKRSMQK